MNTPLVQMDASIEGHLAACEHPGTTIQMDNKAERLAEEHEWCVLFAMDASTDGFVVAHGQYQDFMICLLWMPQQMDLLLHICTIVMHMYTIVMLCVPDLLRRQQSNLSINCVIYVYVMPEEQYLVWHLVKMYKYVPTCVYYAQVWWTTLGLFLSELVEEDSFVHQILQPLSLWRRKNVQSIKYFCMLNFVFLYAKITQLRCFLILLLKEGRVEMCTFSL